MPADLSQQQQDLARIGLLLSQTDGQQERRLPHWRRELELLDALAASLARLAPDRREASWGALLEQRTLALGQLVVGQKPAAAPRRKRAKPAKQKACPIDSALSFYPDFLEQARLAGPEPAPPLPVFQAREELVEKIRRHEVLLLSGETGSGKSLLSPLFALEAGFGRTAGIIQTQPRRVAARQIALRLSEMTGTEPGAPFGCHTRVDRTFTKQTSVKVATDGILLQELRGDPLLSRYDLVILDEAHERSLNIDLLLGLLQRIRETRPELRLIITSATLEQERFIKFWQLSDEQVMEIPGRLFPVELEYREREDENGREDTDALAVRVGQEVRAICAAGEPGDILIFMPRYKEIAATARVLQQLRLPDLAILTMHGRQDPAENARCFRPFPQRKVVIATNIAETSITIPGIRTVIDSGLVNQKQFDPRIGITSLRPRPISQASAKQRSGRAGRLAPGRCIRLWSQTEEEQRPAFTEPEIRRSDLAQLVLHMADLDIEDIPRFPFITRPASQQLSEARRTLIELGALERGGPITDLGRRMAGLPLDPPVARMVLQARAEDCLEQVLTIAAGLSVSRNLFRQPAPDQPGAESLRNRVKQIQQKLADGGSDFDALCALVDGYRSRRWKERKKFCEDHLGSMMALEEVVAIRADLVEALRGSGKQQPAQRGQRRKKPDSQKLTAAIGRSILAGLLGNVAVRISRFAYNGPGDSEVYIHPGSVLFSRDPKPDLIVAGAIEQGEHRTFARHCLALRVDWLQQIAPHLMSYMHRNKRYDERSGRVMAEEEVFFRQLTLSQGKEIDLFTRDAAQAMRILITEGLLADKLGIGLAFHEQNEAVTDEVARLADRLGDPQLAADEEAVIGFYRDRLDGCRNKQDVQRRTKRDPERLLTMSLGDFFGPSELARAQALFPTDVILGGQRCPVAYVYNPWNKRRTATISVPLEALSELEPSELEGIIPGLVEEEAVPRIEVHDRGGKILCNEAGFAAVSLALQTVNAEQAWEDARGELETHPTEQIGQVPGLLDGLCQEIEIQPGVSGTLGLERDTRGWWRKLFSRPEDALARSREALVQFVRLKIALKPQIQQGLTPDVDDKLSRRFYEMTGQSALDQALRQSLEWLACGGFFEVRDFQAGLTLARIGQETERAISLAAELPETIEQILAKLAKLKKRGDDRLAGAVERLKTLAERHPAELNELVRGL